jgi:molecular chaperone GrpE (heat shock protein)
MWNLVSYENYHLCLKVEGGGAVNSYSNLNEKVLHELESLPFMETVRCDETSESVETSASPASPASPALASKPVVDSESDLFDEALASSLETTNEEWTVIDEIMKQQLLDEPETVPERRVRTILDLIRAERNVTYSQKALFEIYDVLDKIHHSFRIHQSTDSDHVRININRVTDILQDILMQYDVEEIEVLHQPFDENQMEKLAAVNLEDWDTDHTTNYVDDQVVEVHQRGFRHATTKLTLRKAKVTTIQINET